MNKYNRFLISFLLTLSMVISFIPSLSFAITENDHDGNHFFELKAGDDGIPLNTTFYFDKNGNKINDTSSVYWIEFTTYDNEMYLSFSANNVVITSLSVKGGPRYRLYTNLGEQTDGFSPPDNPGEEHPQISHYSFEIRIISPPPPPPWEGTIKVIKTFEDSEGEPIAPVEVSFRLTGPNYDQTKLVENGEVIFTGLLVGKYTLTENIPNGFTSNIGNGKTIHLPEDVISNNKVIVNVLNTRNPDDTVPDPKGQIQVHKRVVNSRGEHVNANFVNETFTITLKGPLDEQRNGEIRTLTIDKFDNTGEHVLFDKLLYGTYIIGEELDSSKYSEYKVYDHNVNVLVGPEVEVSGNGLINRWILNTIVDKPPTWFGKLVIQKQIIGENIEEISLEGFKFELWKNGVKYANETPTNPSGIAEFEDLEEGVYTIVETDSKGLNPQGPYTVTISKNIDGDTVYQTFRNSKSTPPQTPKKGKLVIEKIVLGSGSSILSGNGTRFYFDVYKSIEGKWELAEDDLLIIGNNSVDLDLDPGEYRIEEVRIDSDFRLISQNNLKVEIAEEKTVRVKFENRLKPPPPGGDDDDDEDPPKKDDKPKEEPIVDDETKVVPPEPEPEVQPEPEPQPVPEPEPEVVVVEPVPEAVPTLPKTGSASPFIYSGLGTVLLGLGIYLKKKED